MSATAYPEQRTAVVTGAARGIGRAIATRLAADGCRVVALDREEAELIPGAHSLTCDVTDAAAVRSAAETVVHDFGGAAILVNVAGVLRSAPIAELSADDLRTMFEVNVFGVFNCLQAFAPQLRSHAPASVVTVASNAAGIPRTAIGGYGATKAAASLLTRSYGLEEARHGIRCNVVNPGSTDTSMLRSMWSDEEATGTATAAVVAGSPEAFKLGIPAGRIADPQDVADVVAFVVSDQARHLWLQELYVDGGATLLG